MYDIPGAPVPDLGQAAMNTMTGTYGQHGLEQILRDVLIIFAPIWFWRMLTRQDSNGISPQK